MAENGPHDGEVYGLHNFQIYFLMPLSFRSTIGDERVRESTSLTALCPNTFRSRFVLSFFSQLEIEDSCLILHWGADSVMVLQLDLHSHKSRPCFSGDVVVRRNKFFYLRDGRFSFYNIFFKTKPILRLRYEWLEVVSLQ